MKIIIIMMPMDSLQIRN